MLIDSGLYTGDINNIDKQLLMLDNGMPKRVRIDQVVPVFNTVRDIMDYEGSRSVVMLADGSVYDRVSSGRPVDNITTLSVNGDGNSRYILRQAFRENVTRWGVRLGGNISALTASSNAAAIMRAMSSGERLLIPDNIVTIGGPLISEAIPVNIGGGGQRSVIRQLDNTGGLILKNPDRLNEIVLDGFVLESTVSYGTGTAISIEGSFGYNDSEGWRRIVTKSSAILRNITVRGSDMYSTNPPWAKGWNGGLYIENPQSVDVENFFMQGRGARFTGSNANKNSSFGIKFKADRLSTDSTITNCRIADVRTGIELIGDGPVGQPTLEGVRMTHPLVLSTFDAFRIWNTRYGGPGFSITDAITACDRYNVYCSNVRQGHISGGTFYHFGHNESGFAAQVFLDNASSDWHIHDNTFQYIQDRTVSKDPYGILVAGFNKEVFYGSTINGTGVEFAVGNDIHNNYFVGRANAPDPKPAIWLQDSAIVNNIGYNRKERYAKTVVTDLGQNYVNFNIPADPEAGGIVAIVEGERQVITVPLLDDNNDPVLDGSGNVQYVKRIVNRKNEGAALQQAYDSSNNPIANAYKLEAYFSRSKNVLIRSNYISSINESNPSDPQMVISPLSNKTIRELTLQNGQEIRISTLVDIKFVYDPIKMPLKGGRDFTLRPGMTITFSLSRTDTSDAILVEIDRKMYGREVVTTIDTNLGEGGYCYDDSSLPVDQRIGKESNGYPWYIDVKKLSTTNDQWALQYAYNVLSGRALFRTRNGSGVSSGWKQTWGDVSTITNAADETLPDGNYLLNGTVSNIVSTPEQYWHLSHKSVVLGGITYIEQRAVNLFQHVAFLRLRTGEGWSAWRRIDVGVPTITSADSETLPSGNYLLAASISGLVSTPEQYWHLSVVQVVLGGITYVIQRAVNFFQVVSLFRIRKGDGWSAWKRDDPTPETATTADTIVGYVNADGKIVSLSATNAKTVLGIGYLNGITTLAQLKSALNALP